MNSIDSNRCVLYVNMHAQQDATHCVCARVRACVRARVFAGVNSCVRVSVVGRCECRGPTCPQPFDHTMVYGLHSICRICLIPSLNCYNCTFHVH